MCLLLPRTFETDGPRPPQCARLTPSKVFFPPRFTVRGRVHSENTVKTQRSLRHKLSAVEFTSHAIPQDTSLIQYQCINYRLWNLVLAMSLFCLNWWLIVVLFQLVSLCKPCLSVVVSHGVSRRLYWSHNKPSSRHLTASSLEI